MEPVNVNPHSLSQGMNLTASILANTTVNLSTWHLKAADEFASKCRELMSNAQAPWPQTNWESSVYHANAAVMLAAAALEASINELYSTAVEGGASSFSPEITANLNQLASDWLVTKNNPTEQVKAGQDKSLSKILRKYNHVLHVCGIATLYDHTSQAQRLIDLRNSLMHFIPESDSHLIKHDELERKLKPLFPSCEFTNSTDMVWFPFKCLGAGCATWAVDTVKAFSADFCSKLSMAPRL